MIAAADIEGGRFAGGGDQRLQRRHDMGFEREGLQIDRAQPRDLRRPEIRPADPAEEYGLAAIADALGDKATLTLDPTERHGFEYQSWLGFSLFARGAGAEIGRGGTYTVSGVAAGVTGPAIRSQLLNAAWKSSAIMRRSFWACR